VEGFFKENKYDEISLEWVLKLPPLNCAAVLESWSLGPLGAQEWDSSEEQPRPRVFSWRAVLLSHLALSPLQKGKSSAVLHRDICSFLICYAWMRTGAAEEITVHTESQRGESDKTGALRRGAGEQRDAGLRVYSKLGGFLVSCTPGPLKWGTRIYRARGINWCVPTAGLTQAAALQHREAATPVPVQSGLQASSALGEDEILASSQD